MSIVIYLFLFTVLSAADTDILTLHFDHPASVVRRLILLELDKGRATLLLDDGCPQTNLVSTPYTKVNGTQVDFHLAKYTRGDFIRFVGVVGACDSRKCEYSCANVPKLDAQLLDESEFLQTKNDKIVKSRLIQVSQARNRYRVMEKYADGVSKEDLLFGLLLFGIVGSMLTFIVFWLRKVFGTLESERL